MASLAAALSAAAASAAAAPQLTLLWCTGAPSQQFFYNATNGTIQLASTPGTCIDALAYGTTPGTALYTAPCHTDDHVSGHGNQEFAGAPGSSLATAAPLVMRMSGLAVAPSGSAAVPGALVSLGAATGAAAFYLNSSSPASPGPLVHGPSGLCLDAGGGPGGGGQPLTPVALMPCAADGSGLELPQLFTLAGGSLAGAAPTPYNATLCVTAGGNGADGVTATLGAPCPPAGVPLPASQTFVLNATSGQIVAGVGGGSTWVLAAVSSAAPWPGGAVYYGGQPVTLARAAGGGPAADAAFTAQAAPGGASRLVHAASGLCLHSGPLPNSHGCLDPSVRGLPFCNPSLPLASRVGDLLGRLSVAEKVALTGSGDWPSGDACDTIDPGVPRLGVPPLQWLVETNSMAASQCYGATCATAFPAALNLAASFNRSLWASKGSVIGDEMRALNNLGWHRGDNQAGTMVSLSGQGPDINHPRDPRNGRIGELPSEDPALTGAYAVEVVRAMQAPDPSTGGLLKMTASLKHYAGYSMETGRFGSVGNFSVYDLWDTYLPPFEAGYVGGGAAGSMCAYISLSVGGPGGPPYVPACANPWLLTDVVRGYWGRPDAYYISDCGAVENMYTQNHYAKNATVAAADALNAGLDLNSELILPQQLGAALALGLTTEATLDAAVGRTLAWRFRTGLLDPIEGQAYMTYGLERFGTPGHRAAAMEGAAQGLVLVKNERGALPLRAGASLAVVGPTGASTAALAGDWYGDSLCPGNSPGPAKSGTGCLPTLAAALAAANAGGTTASVTGVTISGNDTSWGEALAAVAAADAVVLALGTDPSVAGEGTDRADSGLPGVQAAFAAAVMAAAGPSKPVVLVLVSDFPVAFDSLAGPGPGSPPAVVLAYAPVFGAPAVAAALYGANRWGRSVLTHYPHAYQASVALNDFRVATGQAAGAPPSAPAHFPGRSYRYYDGSAGAPLVRFGQGLTYATTALACTGGWAPGGGPPGPSGSLDINCTLTPTAGPAGDQVLMVFHRPGDDVVARIGGAHPVPLASLRDFGRAALPAAGGGGGVPFTWSLPAATALALTDGTGASVLYAGTHYLDVWDGGANNVTIAVELPFPAAQRGGSGSGDDDAATASFAWVLRRPPPPR
jgi:xylan 1,4-beta-xylosidase